MSPQRDRRKRSRSHSSSRSEWRTTTYSRSSKYRRTNDHSRYRTQFGQDSKGHILYDRGDYLENRYILECTLGKGTFGKVIRCWDRKRNRGAAIKVIRNVQRYLEAANPEIKILSYINKLDPYDEHGCVRMYDWFDIRGHVCIVFEMLGSSVYDILEKDSERETRLFRTVLHKNHLTHTDLKPENILFVSSDSYTETIVDWKYSRKVTTIVKRIKNTKIKLVDFGSATFDHEPHQTVVSTRHYRAPEVIFQLGWTHPCDVWSIGCILFELYNGKALFQTHDNEEHLAMMQKILGPFPTQMISDSSVAKKYRFRDGKLDYTNYYVERDCKPLEKYITVNNENHRNLFHLIKKMLDYRPNIRISLSNARDHRFFRKHDDRHSGSRPSESW